MRREAMVTVALVITVAASAGLAAAAVQYTAPNAVETPAAIVSDGPAWGTVALSKLTLAPWDFVPISSAVTYDYMFYPSTLYRTNAAGAVWFQAPFHLQSGALVTQFEVQYCDTSATLMFGSYLQVHNVSGGGVSSTSLVASTEAGTPGCVVQTATLVSPVTVANIDNFYLIQVNLGGTGSAGSPDVRVGAVKVGYRLQISPAPAVAAFADVPTDYWAFRHIEALYASGITSGCGTGPLIYCPERTITRAEMAVYMAKALGLHWVDQPIGY